MKTPAEYKNLERQCGELVFMQHEEDRKREIVRKKLLEIYS